MKLFLARVQVQGIPLRATGEGTSKAKAKTAAATKYVEQLLKFKLVAAHEVPAHIEVRVRI